MTLHTIPATLFALGVIIFVHELGHYLVAKVFGVRVMVFSLGFGRRLWGVYWRGTDYRVSLLPLGGYVRMGGELPGEGNGHPSDFSAKPRWQRILVYLAGPAMNVVLAVALIAIVFMVGIPVAGLLNAPPVVGFIADDSPALAAGLEVGDRIVTVDGKAVATWSDVDFEVTTAPERPLNVTYLRGDVEASTELVPLRIPRYELGDAGFAPRQEVRLSDEYQLRLREIIDGTAADRAGFLAGDVVLRVDGTAITSDQDFISKIQPRIDEEVTIDVLRGGQPMSIPVTPELDEGVGRIGVYPVIYRQLGLLPAVVESARYNVEIVDKTFQILGKLLTAKLAAKSALSGPIEIAVISGRAAEQGFDTLLYLMGFLSISIGIMNLLPIPVLDGGHIVILLIESLRRRDLSITVKERFTQVGFMLLMMLMVVVLFFDLSKNVPGMFGGS